MKKTHNYNLEHSPLRLFWGFMNSIVYNASGTPAGKYLLLKKILKIRSLVFLIDLTK